jgi:hypothetical protein
MTTQVTTRPAATGGWLVDHIEPDGSMVWATCPDIDCRSLLPADGVCRWCEQQRERPTAMQRIHGIGWDSATTEEQRQEAQAITATWYGLLAAVEKEAKEPANGCVVCGADEHGHGQRYGIGGWHTWAAPPDSLRLGRMRARRAVADRRIYREVSRRFTAIYPEPANT